MSEAPSSALIAARDRLFEELILGPAERRGELTAREKAALAVEIGLDPRDSRWTLRLLVSGEPGLFATQYEGFPVEVVVASEGTAPAASGAPADVDFALPPGLVGGLSIGAFEVGFGPYWPGTLGALVRKAGNSLQWVGLTAQHVVFSASQMAGANGLLFVAHPAGTNVRIGIVSENSPLRYVNEPGLNANMLDCALISFDPGVLSAPLVHGLGPLSESFVKDAELPRLLADGVEICKVGASTGVTRGRIAGIETGTQLHTERGMVVLDRQLSILSDDGARFAEHGDSGALLVAVEGGINRPLGLHLGSAGGKSFATPIERIVRQFGIQFT